MYSVQIFQLVSAVVLALLMSTTVTQAKVYSRCDLANNLIDNGIPKENVSSWVCLIDAVSGGDSSLVRRITGGANYGIFQINSIYWCCQGIESKFDFCHANCKDFIDDAISDDIKCGKEIYSRQGFAGWTPNFKAVCPDDTLKDYIADCNF